MATCGSQWKSGSHLNKVNPHSFQIQGEFCEVWMPLPTKVNVTEKWQGGVKWHDLKVNLAIIVKVHLGHALCEKFEDALQCEIFFLLWLSDVWKFIFTFHKDRFKIAQRYICSEAINYTWFVLLWWALTEKMTLSFLYFVSEQDAEQEPTDNVDRVAVQKLQFKFVLIHNSLWIPS